MGRLETLVEPELLVSAPSAGQRAVPEDIREFRAARYRAAERPVSVQRSPCSVTSSERDPPRSRCSQR
jgi:hypothetical protein